MEMNESSGEAPEAEAVKEPEPVIPAETEAAPVSMEDAYKAPSMEDAYKAPKAEEPAEFLGGNFGKADDITRNAEASRRVSCAISLSFSIVNGNTIDARESSTTNIRNRYNTDAESSGMAPASATISKTKAQRTVVSGIAK